MKFDEVPFEFVSKPIWKWRDVIIDASRTSIYISHGSHRRRNVKSANHFQIILPINERYFVFNLEHLIIPLFFPRGYSLPCCIQQFHLFQILIDCPGNLIQWRGGGGFNWRQWADAALERFLSGERNSQPDCFGVVSVEPRGVCKPCEWWRWWGYASAFQTGSCKSTFNHLVWAWLQRGRGALHQTGLGSGPIPANRIIKTAAYLWAKNRFTAVVHFVLGRLYLVFFHRPRQLVVMRCSFEGLLGPGPSSVSHQHDNNLDQITSM